MTGSVGILVPTPFPCEVSLLPTDRDVRIRVTSADRMLDVVGPHDAHIRAVSDAFPDAQIVSRGDEFHVTGASGGVANAQKTLREMITLVKDGQKLDLERVGRIIDMVNDDVKSPSEVMSGGLTVSRGRVIRPKTAGHHSGAIK